MIEPILHRYTPLINSETSWLGNDSESVYNENLISNYNLLEQHGWINRNIRYKFNSHGFRTNNFDTLPSIMFLGCSNTVGIGLPQEHTWPFIVSKKLNLEMINLGIGGIGEDAVFRIADYYVEKIKPKIAVFLQPPIGRLSLITNSDIHYFRIMDFDLVPESYKPFYQDYIATEENLTLSIKKHKMAIENICLKNNVKFVYVDDISTIDLARDLNHPGIQSNAVLANRVLGLTGSTDSPFKQFKWGKSSPITE